MLPSKYDLQLWLRLGVEVRARVRVRVRLLQHESPEYDLVLAGIHLT